MQPKRVTIISLRKEYNRLVDSRREIFGEYAGTVIRNLCDFQNKVENIEYEMERIVHLMNVTNVSSDVMDEYARGEI